MKLEHFKEMDNKRTCTIVFTIVCILLVSGVILYRTFAIFEVNITQNIIDGKVQDPGNLYFAFYQKNEESGNYEIQQNMPNLEEGYVLDELQSYCGLNGEKDKDIKVYLSEDGYIKVKGMKTSRTKCNLYFTKGVFLNGKGVPVVEKGNGLYAVEHTDANITDAEEHVIVGWNETEYRYAGVNYETNNDDYVHNYVNFNNEAWRIIGMVNVKIKKEDGTEAIEQRLKITRNENLQNRLQWDENNLNDWSQATLMKYLNEEYYNGNEENTLKDETSKKMIDEQIVWSLGGTRTLESDLVTTLYAKERGPLGNSKNLIEWKKGDTNQGIFHSIGLAYPSDYGYATSGGTIGRTECFKTSLYNWKSAYNVMYLNQCAKTDWLMPSSGWYWTLTPQAQTNLVVYIVSSEGWVTTSYANNERDIFPVLYLKKNVKITGGTGAYNDMFQLE